MPLGVEADAARRMPRRVDHPQAAEQREHLAVDDRASGRSGVRVRYWMRRPRRTARSSVARERLPQRQSQAGEVVGMDQDGDVVAVADELAHAADVVGMAVRADDPLQLVHAAADATQVSLEHEARADHAGVDQGQPLLGDQERVGPEHPDLVHARRDLHGARDCTAGYPASPGRRSACADTSRTDPREIAPASTAARSPQRGS